MKFNKNNILKLVLCLALALAVVNYDRIAAKIVKKLPATIDNYLAERYLPDNFWLHRVNSTGKQEEFADKYKGIEFDIIYYAETDTFENSHDKTDAVLYDLEKQLAVYQKIGQNKGIWFDFKNLTEENKVQAKNKIDLLLAKYGINKQKVWVESGNWQAIKVFHDDGYHTSYYLPYYKFDEMTDKEIADAKARTEMIAASGNVDAVSFYGGYYDFISSMQLPPRIALLSWLDGRKWTEVLLLNKYSSLVNDQRLQALLVKDRGHYSR